MKSQLVYALLLAASLSAGPAPGSPSGELDPAFGDHGRILLRGFGAEEFRGVDVFVDPDSGRLLAAGDGYNRDALLRFNSDGSLDGSFGNQGEVPLDFGDDRMNVSDVEWLPDDKLLIAGAMNVFGDPDNVIHGAGLLARMHADGTPDRSFGRNGRAIFELGGVYEILSEVMVQADGRIVVFGSTNRTGAFEIVLARFSKDGLPDVSFGSGGTPGIAVIDVTGIDAVLPAIVQQADGKFMACGYAISNAGSRASSEVLAVRVRADGVRDSTFGNNGTASIGGWQESIEIVDCLELADGHLMLAGSSGKGEEQRAAALRLTPDGRLDTAFGDDGMVVLDTNLPSNATAMLAMSDGSLAIAGTNWKIANGSLAWADMLVARIDPTSGAIDRGFGDRGVTTVDFGTRGFPGVAVPARLRQQADGKLVILGFQVDRYDWYYAYSIALARIDPYGSGSNGWAGLVDAHTSVPPEADAASLLLRRTGGSSGELSVDYRTEDGTAIAGEDYVSVSGTVTWPDGDWSDKAISIEMLRAESEADVQAFNVELLDSSGGLALDLATVSILGPPKPPVTRPPAGGGSNGNDSSNGGGAIGSEFWFLMTLALVGIRGYRYFETS